MEETTSVSPELSRGSSKRMMTLYIERDLYTPFKVKLAQKEIPSMTSWVNEQIRQFIAS